MAIRKPPALRIDQALAHRQSSGAMPRRETIDDGFIARICHVAQIAHGQQYEDVAAWMQKHLASDIAAKKKHVPRVRGIEVRLTNSKKSKATLSLERVREMSEEL